MHIISVAGWGFLTLVFRVESLAQRTTVDTMKMAASPANEAMAMRHCDTRPRVEQGWDAVGGGHFSASVEAGGPQVDLEVDAEVDAELDLEVDAEVV